MAGGNDPIRIDIPRGGYVPTFTPWPRPPEPGSEIAAEGTAADHAPAGATIAVMPLLNVGGDPEQLFFVNGLVDELVSELNRYEDVICIPCREVVASEDGTASARESGQLLGARFVLGGSVRRDTTQMKVAAQLIDVPTGHQIWSDTYAIPLVAARLIATQEDIARGVLFLVADDADFITGSTLSINGGQHMY